nr:unnamed protein product [Digitaria exilis]
MDAPEHHKSQNPSVRDAMQQQQRRTGW